MRKTTYLFLTLHLCFLTGLFSQTYSLPILQRHMVFPLMLSSVLLPTNKEIFGLVQIQVLQNMMAQV
jgi:hypothetical protein